MCLFVETIRIEQGKACLSPYHNERLNATRRHFFPGCEPIRLENHLRLSPEMNEMKCRVIYGKKGIKEITYAPYVMRQVRSLQLVRADDVDYSYKSIHRAALNELFDRRGTCDDVLIVKDGLLTDTSVANIALFDGTAWHTPAKPLLKGTRRASLIAEGIIKERNIIVTELSGYTRIRLFNAMIHWGSLETSVKFIHESG